MNTFRSAAECGAHWRAWEEEFDRWDRAARRGPYAGAGLLDAIWIDHLRSTR